MEKPTPTDPTYVILGDASLPLRYTVAAMKRLVKHYQLKNAQELLKFEPLLEAPIENVGVFIHHGLSEQDAKTWPIEKIEGEIPFHQIAEYVLAVMGAITNATPEKLKATGEAAASEKKVNGISSLSSGASPESISDSPTPSSGTAPSES